MIVHITIIVAIILLMYARTINYGYIIDDQELMQNSQNQNYLPTKNNLHKIWQHFLGCKLTDPRITHAWNLLPHTLNCVLIYLLFGKNDISFLTALLFALNPANNQVSVWMSGRWYGLFTTMLLAGLYIPFFLPILYCLALYLTGSIVLFAPLLFTKLQPHYLLLLFPVGLYFSIKRIKPIIDNRKTMSTETMNKINWRKVIIFFKTIGYYLCLCLFPFKVGMFHEYLDTYGMSVAETKRWEKLDGFFFLGLGFIGYVVWSYFFHYNMTTFGLFWFLLFIAQWGNILTINHLITERYLYLANIGLMFSLATLITHTPLALVFLTFYAVRLHYVIPSYRNIREYFMHNIINFPNAALGWNQYGLAMVQWGNEGTAFDAFIQGVQRRPNDFRLNYNIANMLASTGRPAIAVPFLQKAAENIHKANNYEYWRDGIYKIRDYCQQQGCEVKLCL